MEFILHVTCYSVAGHIKLALLPLLYIPPSSNASEIRRCLNQVLEYDVPRPHALYPASHNAISPQVF